MCQKKIQSDISVESYRLHRRPQQRQQIGTDVKTIFSDLVDLNTSILVRIREFHLSHRTNTLSWRWECKNSFNNLQPLHLLFLKNIYIQWKGRANDYQTSTSQKFFITIRIARNCRNRPYWRIICLLTYNNPIQKMKDSFHLNKQRITFFWKTFSKIILDTFLRR